MLDHFNHFLDDAFPKIKSWVSRGRSSNGMYHLIKLNNFVLKTEVPFVFLTFDQKSLSKSPIYTLLNSSWYTTVLDIFLRHLYYLIQVVVKQFELVDTFNQWCSLLLVTHSNPTYYCYFSRGIHLESRVYQHIFVSIMVL